MSKMPKGCDMIVTLTGTNAFLISQELANITAKFVEEYGKLGIEKIDGEEAEYERITEALQSLPFLIEKKLVILRHPSKNKKFNENIEQIISTIPDTNIVVIIEQKIDRRQNYFKILKSKTDFKEFNDLDQNGLTKWVMQFANELGGNISYGDANLLIDRVGSNQQLLFNEITKLVEYEKNITQETIVLLTDLSPQSTVFELLDAAFTGKSKTVLALYEDQRRQRVEPRVILAMVAWQLYVLTLIKTAGDKSIDDIAKSARLNPFVVRKSFSIASKLTFTEVKRLVSEALELDVRLKSQKIDHDDAMRHFLLALSVK